MRRIPGFVGALVIIVIITAGIIFSLWAGARSQTQKLPDGSLVVLRAVTYGKAPQYAPGTFWQRLAASSLPAKYASHFRALAYGDTNGGPAMVVWIEHITRAPFGSVQYGGFPTYGNPPDWQGLFDDSGTDFDKSVDVLTSTRNGVLQGFIFHALPNTSSDLHFRFVCADSNKQWQATAVFTFPNPAFSQPAQKPAAYPIAAEQDKLRLVLNGFHAEPSSTNHPNWMGLSFDLFEDGRPANDWELHTLDVLDRNGGIYHPYEAEWEHGENHTKMSFMGGLSTNAPWRLRFVLKHASFQSNELCTVTNLPISDEDLGTTNLASVPINGTTLVIIPRGSGYGSLNAMIVPADDKYYLDLVNVLTTNGHPADRGKTYSWGRTDTNYSLGFPPGVTNVDLKFGVTRKVFIEVVAQPTPR